MIKHVKSFTFGSAKRIELREVTKHLDRVETLIRRTNSLYLDLEVLPVTRLREDRQTINTAIAQLRLVFQKTRHLEDSEEKSALLCRDAKLYLNAAILRFYLENIQKGDFSQDGRQAIVKAISDPVIGETLKAEIIAHGTDLLFIGDFTA